MMCVITHFFNCGSTLKELKPFSRRGGVLSAGTPRRFDNELSAIYHSGRKYRLTTTACHTQAGEVER
jgi:hypothetical protein